MRANLPPYGPIKGMLDGVSLVERLAPDVVDLALLKQHGIARANEYKVLQALRFLGLIDAAGRTTPDGRLLRARGPARTEALRRVVRRAYADLLLSVDLATASRDDIHNYFVTHYDLSRDLAAKSAAFFLELARLADLTASTGPGSEGPPTPLPAPVDPPANRDASPGWPCAEPAAAVAPVSTSPFADASPGSPFAEPADRRGPVGPSDPASAGLAPLLSANASAGGPVVAVVLGAADVEARTDGELTELMRRVRRAWADSAVDYEGFADHRANSRLRRDGGPGG